MTNSDDQINTLTDVFCLYKGENPNDTNCIQLENAFVTSLTETGATQNGFAIQEFFKIFHIFLESLLLNVVPLQ